MGRKPNQTGNKDVFYSPTDIWQSMDAVTRESVHVIVVVQIFLWRSHCPLLPYSELKSHTQVLSFPAMVTMANPGGMPERRSRPSVRVPLSAKAKGELQPPSLPLSLSLRASAYPSLVQPLQCFLWSDGVFFPYCFFEFIQEESMSFCFHSLSLPLALQNKFSSKIAIKSLWKFMSIVAAICRGGEKN